MSAVKRNLALLAFVCIGAVSAQQSTHYILTEFPVAAMASTDSIWVKWTGLSRDIQTLIPDSGKIYFSRSPGGMRVTNYTDSVTVFTTTVVKTQAGQDTTVAQNNMAIPGSPPQRGIRFVPGRQPRMGAGVYYYIVAFKTRIGLTDTVYYSNELTMIIESDKATVPVAPVKGAVISDLTPTFTWNANPGVPYYHVILSDEEIAANTGGDTMDITGLSIVWQAITPNTQITYGAPDPSGTITADPPPISPGKTYSWLVLNNYGNHPAYTSRRFGLPEAFTIQGTPLKTPLNLFPAEGHVFDRTNDTNVVFKWTNLDSRANTYQVYLYIYAEYEGHSAQIVVWSSEVSAAQFSGDTAWMAVDVSSILVKNTYIWRVIAVDDRGGGTAGEQGMFQYEGRDEGQLIVRTRELVSSGQTTLEKNVSAVQLQMEVLDGSMDAPILYYTDQNGFLSRQRPVGTYRLTTIKNGFLNATKTVTVTTNDTADVTFFMERPDATVYGKVFNTSGKAIDLATVYAVSDDGDTVNANSDVLGNFVLSCHSADWTIWAQKDGYKTSLSRDTTVSYGQSVNVGSIILERNSLSLSGVITNATQQPLIGVLVGLYRDGTLIASLPSTPQTGAFSFAVNPGTYTIVASKAGFVTARRTLELAGSQNVNLTMAAGAAMIRGFIYGSSWGAQGRVFAPITSARVMLVDTATVPPDTFKTVSNAVYGDFQISVAGDRRYQLHAEANGFVSKLRLAPVATVAGQTHTVNDTLMALAMLSGSATDTNDAALSGVNVTVVDTNNSELSLRAKSEQAGTFELRNLPDGIYRISGGKTGFAVRSITLIDTAGQSIASDVIEVSDGRVVVTQSSVRIIARIVLQFEPGAKTLVWRAVHDNRPLTDAVVKISSPLKMTLNINDSLQGVGPGTYVMTMDARGDTIIDIARHVFVMPSDTNILWNDSVNFVVGHQRQDSTTVSGGTVAIVLKAYDTDLDSGWIYFKDIDQPAYQRQAIGLPDTNRGIRYYTFNVAPPRDGSHLQYYFRVYKASSIFGYDRETFRTYVRPDALTLTKLAVSPAVPGDTVLLAAQSALTFTFAGYYGSRFLPDASLPGNDIRWSLLNGGGCVLSATRGLQTTLTTPAGGVGGIVTLCAVIDTVSRHLKPGLSDTVKVAFRVSAQALARVTVRRTDSDPRAFITTDVLDKARFTAEGYDAAGQPCVVTPQWQIVPQGAGSFSNGTFVPSSSFAGYARFIAQVDKLRAEYNAPESGNPNHYGLEVRYQVPVAADTMDNGRGLKIFLTDSVVDPLAEAQISVDMPVLENRVELNTGEYTVISDVYNLTINSQTISRITFRSSTRDSLVVAVRIPEAFRDAVEKGGAECMVAHWDEDSLQWRLLTHSQVDAESHLVYAKVSHFSRYALLYKKRVEKAVYEIKPNPFSPYIRPRAEFGEVYGEQVPFGACIVVTPKSTTLSVNLHLQVFNVVGDPVLTCDFGPVTPGRTYHVWWDGKTNSDQNATFRNGPIDNSSLKSYLMSGNKLCRNGRYFVVATIRQNTTEVSRMMKPVVILK